MMLNAMTRPTTAGPYHESIFKTSAQLEWLQYLLKKGCPAELALELVEETNSHNYVVKSTHDTVLEQAANAERLRKRDHAEANLAKHVNELRVKIEASLRTTQRAIEWMDSRVRNKLGARKARREIRHHLKHITGLLGEAATSDIPPGFTYELAVGDFGYPFCHFANTKAEAVSPKVKANTQPL